MNPWPSAPPAPPPFTGDDSNAAAGEKSSGEKIFHNILLMSYKYNDNNNLMLAAVISLLLVILIVLLLHVYARCFFSPSRHHRVAADNHVVLVGITPAALPENKRKGLGRSDIARNIPLFVYEGNGEEEEDEGCVICLSGFEDGDLGRKLPKCSHAFHADCIDMWLFSHPSCPVCRAPVVTGGDLENDGGGEAASAVVPP
ncbi:unnamed protein product [Cuscuta campestris]|uniref:RING-type domain-containing protein n=2 Tax=Cuscuta sect. Cleistogrammica TaxID=1824901 RepID=A0A484NHH5_9ASTE|nr:hypothetical protein DM860_012132 [Cuscuta australis]VFR00414.1 unnamed protein product [Cuscuta campestris]